MAKRPAKNAHIHKRLIMLAILGVAMVMALGITQYRQEVRSRAASLNATCTVSDKLVNSCRPWLGAYSNSYPGSSDKGMKAQILDHEKRIGKQADVVHYYHPVGSIPLNPDEKFFINRANTIAYVNWKPAQKWADAAGGNSSINANIDKAADSIKSVAPKKLILTIHHEPENDISSGISCATLKGSSGSPKDYVNMWHNVRKRFDAKGVNNVVWAFTITGYKGWFCTLDALYPGDKYVDWIAFDTYGGSNSDDFYESNDIIYKYLTDNSNSTHNYLSKPWGIAETSNFNTDKAQSYKFWDDAKAAVESNKYPNIKLYMVFDSKNKDGDFRIAYDKNGGSDPKEQEHYKAFAHSKAFAGTGVIPTAGPPAPVDPDPKPTDQTNPNPTDPADPIGVTPTVYCIGAGSCPVVGVPPDISNIPMNPGGGGGTLPPGFLEMILDFIFKLLFGTPAPTNPAPTQPDPTVTVGPSVTIGPTITP